MYVILRSGARQYRAEVGKTLEVEKIATEEGEAIEVGERIEINEVLMVVDGDNTVIGQPLVEGAKVEATIINQYKGAKIIVWKYRPKQRYRRKKGHRQHYTRLRIDNIITG